MGSKERPKPMQKKGAKPEMKAKRMSRPMQKKEAKPEIKEKERPRQMQNKEARSKRKVKGRSKPMQKEVNLRVRPCAWGLICRDHIGTRGRVYECGADNRIMAETVEILKREH